MTSESEGRAIESAVESVEAIGPAAEQAKADVWGDVWKPLGDWPSQTPPHRKWLVVRPKDKKDANGVRPGVLPLGKVGLLAGAGAAGKSWLTTQLAVAVATGATWVGLEIDTPGRVLLVLGEEEEEEAMRRLHYAGKMMELTPAQKVLAGKNLVVLPMAGCDVALTQSLDRVEPGKLPETPLLHELRRRLQEVGKDAPQWALVVLDPLARFAGSDVETDNAAATRFIQVLEQLVKAPGNPTVLVTHHTTKTARREGAGGSDTAAATAQRGASALTDGVRWQANLEARERFKGAPRLIDFRVVKTNYGPPVDPIPLSAPDDSHGALRPATEEESHQWSEADEQKKVEAKRKDKSIHAKAQGKEGGKFSDGPRESDRRFPDDDDDDVPESPANLLA